MWENEVRQRECVWCSKMNKIEMIIIDLSKFCLQTTHIKYIVCFHIHSSTGNVIELIWIELNCENKMERNVLHRIYYLYEQRTRCICCAAFISSLKANINFLQLNDFVRSLWCEIFIEKSVNTHKPGPEYCCFALTPQNSEMNDFRFNFISFSLHFLL